MSGELWILLDTETTGFTAPVFVVELATQRMCGWQSDGEPFRKLLNQNADIPAEASRVHGYTREILERDGEPAHQVYRAFAEYAGNLPLVSFNLEYDLDEVLKPEWKRLGIGAIGSRGFCALRLAQRLLDPVPAGNCKLQTLRQYYRLPERGAHTALGDVQTVADLMAQVLRPIAGHRGLDTWEKLVAFAAEEWFPSRIAFGKHKGRLIQEARKDAELRGWLDWLWKKLVKLYHPDRFANQPDKLETYHKLTAAINRAKEAGDIQTLREIAEDPHGFILRQGWATLDFSDAAELAQLRRLHETLQLEIIAVLESLNRLRESPDYELCQLSEKKPSLLDELAAERKKLLEKESADLEKQAERLAEEIKELGGGAPSRIV